MSGIAQDGSKVKDLVDIVALDGGGNFGRFGYVASDDIHFVSQLADALTIRIAIEQDQVLASKTFFAHEIAGQVRSQETRAAGDHYCHWGTSLRRADTQHAQIALAAPRGGATDPTRAGEAGEADSYMCWARSRVGAIRRITSSALPLAVAIASRCEKSTSRSVPASLK